MRRRILKQCSFERSVCRLEPRMYIWGLRAMSRHTWTKDALMPALWIVAAMLALLGGARIAAAAPTQEEVFKSIQDNVGDSADSGKVLMVLCVGGGFVILLAVFSQRNKREITPRTVNHQGRLLKEIGRGLSIRPKEMKQLKILAEQTSVPGGRTVNSPLTLLLCPSVLMKAVQNPRCKADRRVLQQILRKTIAVNPPGQTAVAPAAAAARRGRK